MNSTKLDARLIQLEGARGENLMDCRDRSEGDILQISDVIGQGQEAFIDQDLPTFSDIVSEGSFAQGIVI